VTRIEGHTSYARPPEEVFDLRVDPRHEPEYNSRVLSARKETPGPIGPGTRFAQRVKSFGRTGEVSILLVDCERPHHLVWAIGSTGMDVDGAEEIRQEGEQTTVQWAWDFRPRGVLRVLGPLVGWAGRRLERRVWADMKEHLEVTTMATSARPHRHETTTRPVLGLRRRPGRLALVVFRLPLPLYRAGWGWLFLGHTFLVLTHVGRKTGTPHATAAMVLAEDRTTGEVVICSAWGPRADWIRNLHARPALRVQIGRTTFVPQHRFLTEEEAFAVGTEFRHRHPWRVRLISSVLGVDLHSDAGIREFVGTRPFVALRPARSVVNGGTEPADPLVRIEDGRR
jgi:deazaflavin-dependent oxidoreductase (nitroreductase family)